MLSYEKCKNGISIIIPNHNGEKVLKISLISMANQTFPKDMYEIIIVDNASIDESLKVIEQVAQKYPKLALKVIRLNKNLGYGRAINIGALNAKFELILASNNDIIFHPKYLENLYRTYCYSKRIDKKIVAAQGLHMYYPDVNCIYNAGGLISLLNGRYRFYGICLTWKEFSKIMRWAHRGETKFSYIAFPNGAGALIEKEFFLKVGGYYRLYFSGIEEVDLGLLIHLLGHHIIFIPSAVQYHIEGHTLGGRSTFIPHKLFLILNGFFIYSLSFYDVLHFIQYYFAYALALLMIMILSVFIREKNLVWVIIKTLITNSKIKRMVLVRRSKILTLQKVSLNEIFAYFRTVQRYVSIVKVISSFFVEILYKNYRKYMECAR